MRDPSTPLTLEYRLAEADVRDYRTAGRARKCWLCCRSRKASLLILVALGSFLVGTCHRAHGVRSSAMALGTTLVVLAALAWGREARLQGRVLRLARQMGLPRDVRLVLSPEGLAEESGAGSTDPSRTFAWAEVVDIARINHLTVIHLRPAGGVLIVPDGAFATLAGRAEFEAALGRWRAAAARRADLSQVG